MAHQEVAYEEEKLFSNGLLGKMSRASKTTLACALAEQLGAVFLRIDTIEQALSQSQALYAPGMLRLAIWRRSPSPPVPRSTAQ
jgi:hypothetical protein